jgi:hypothetical protein
MRRRQVLSITMLFQRMLVSAACLLLAAAVFAEEPECATNYRTDGGATETFVLTGLTPQAVIERLPRKLAAAGASMHWTDPEKGTLKAEGLDVKAEVSGNVTRVTFRSSAAADKTTLCRYASLVGNPPGAPKAAVPQDPTLIAKIKEDLIKKHQVFQVDTSNGLDNARFSSMDDFLEFAIEDIKPIVDDQRQYGVSVLVPRVTCSIAREDMPDASIGLIGKDAEPRTKPVRVNMTLSYARYGGEWHLTDATITQMESTK